MRPGEPRRGLKIVPGFLVFLSFSFPFSGWSESRKNQSVGEVKEYVSVTLYTLQQSL